MAQAKQRMPDPEAVQLIVHAIRSANAPITASTLGKQPGIGTSARVKLLLAEHLAKGGVFHWGKVGYWHVDPGAVARERVLEVVSRECLSLSGLKRSVSRESPKLTTKTVQVAISELISEKRLLPKETKASNVSGIIDLKYPEPYLQRKIAAVLKSVGIERSANRISALLEPEIEPPVAAAALSQDVQGVAEKMFATMNRVAFAPGTTVTFHILRQQPELAQIPKRIFDQAALLLQQERRALLMVHDFAAALPHDEQERFVTDGLGNFYVSIYAR